MRCSSSTSRCLQWKVLSSICVAMHLDAIADKAIERKTGARGLRSILETVLLDTMYRIPSETSVVKVVVDAAVINGENEPLLVYEQNEQNSCW